MLLQLENHIVKDIIADDPVRPHIDAEWRTRSGREVYGLYTDESFEELRAVICVAYTTDMARNFHLKNGAKFLNKHTDCQNFEY